MSFGGDPNNPQAQGIVPFINPQSPTGSPNLFYDQPQELAGYNAAASAYQDTSQSGGPNNYILYDNPTSVITGHNLALMGSWLGQLSRDPFDYNHHTISIIPFDNTTDPELTFALQYLGGDGKWHYYNMMARLQEIAAMSYSSGEIPGSVGPVIFYQAARPDPRTDRFSAAYGIFDSAGQNYNWGWNNYAGADTVQPSNYSINSYNLGNPGAVSAEAPRTTAGFTYFDNRIGAGGSGNAWPGYLEGEWMRNGITSTNSYYTDPDGVARPGDGWHGDYQLKTTTGPFTVGGDGIMTYEHIRNTSPAVTQGRSRAVIMDRPYQSVGELGYVFRDQPFKTLDFWSPWSADTGLLDLFSAVDEPPVAAGEVNVSNAPKSELQAILSGTIKQRYPSMISGSAQPSTYPVYSSASEANYVASAISGSMQTNGPLNNRSDLVYGLSTNVFNALGSYQSTVSTTDNPQDNKSYGEAYVRALAPVTNTRTWNLLIDVVAQSGHMAQTAKSLNDFVVDGERRYWLHISIDRYTGKIVDQQLEPVYE